MLHAILPRAPLAAALLSLTAAACAPAVQDSGAEARPPGRETSGSPAANPSGLDRARGSGAAADTAVEAVARYLRGLEGIGFSGGVLVARADEILLARGLGLADREEGTPWNAKTVFSLGSVTKPVTAAGILLLAERGRLDLDDTLGELFPGAPSSHASIPIRSLLTHTSGLPDFDQRAFKDTDPVSRERMIELALGAELLGSPGERYRYSNLGYSLLGAIIEIVSGRPYEAFLREELFLPAGAAMTGYRLPGWEAGRLAVGYRRGRRWGTLVQRFPEGKPPFWVLRANGGLHTTLREAHRLVQATLGGGVLSPPSVRLLSTPAHDITDQVGQAVGWIADRTGSELELRHAGSNGILSAQISHFPASRRTVVVASNISEWNAVDVAGAVSRILLGEEIPAPSPAAGRRPVGEAHRVMAGGWTFPERGSLRVRDMAEFLALDVHGDALIAELLDPEEEEAARLAAIQRRARAVVRTLRGIGGPEPSPEISPELRELWPRLTKGVRPSDIESLGTAPVWYHSPYATWIRLGRGPGSRLRRIHWSADGRFAALGGPAYPAPLTLLCIAVPQGRCLTRHLLLPAISATVEPSGDGILLRPEPGRPVLRGRPRGGSP